MSHTRTLKPGDRVAGKMYLGELASGHMGFCPYDQTLNLSGPKRTKSI